MPKRVDHEVRRREITDAVCRVTARSGLAAATFREVAAEADCSVRLVQYYFGSKAKLLEATRTAVGELSITRLGEWIEASDGSPRGVVEALLKSFIPTDDASRGAMVMYIAFAADALIAGQNDPAARKALVRETEMMHNGVLDQLVDGEIRSGVEPEIAAAIATAMMPGLSNNVLNETMTVDQAYASIDYYLDSLFSGEPDL